VRRQRWILVAAAAGLTVAAVTLGGVLHEASAPSPAAAAAPASPAVQAAPGDTTGTVTQLQTKLRSNPDDVSALDSLGLAYQQRARETGDPTYYTKSGEALHKALALVPDDLAATSGLGTATAPGTDPPQGSAAARYCLRSPASSVALPFVTAVA